MLMLKQTKHRYPLKIKGFHGKCTIKESVKSVAKLGFNFKVQNLYTYTYIHTNKHTHIHNCTSKPNNFFLFISKVSIKYLIF